MGAKLSFKFGARNVIGHLSLVHSPQTIVPGARSTVRCWVLGVGPLSINSTLIFKTHLPTPFILHPFTFSTLHPWMARNRPALSSQKLARNMDRP